MGDGWVGWENKRDNNYTGWCLHPVTHDPPQMMTADHIITASDRGKHRHRRDTIEFLIENVKKGVFENLKM